MSIVTKETRKRIREALKEDIGAGDVTTTAFIQRGGQGTAVLISKAAGVLAGRDVFAQTFHAADKRLRIKWQVKDAARLRPGQKICVIQGALIPILSAERTALNFLMRLSGIATLTRRYVEKVRGTGVKICDTRKTTPLWRALEKYAVRTGGGTNHRMGLFDQIFVKDNHWKLIADSMPIREALAPLSGRRPVIEMELDQLTMLDDILKVKPAVLLLDNFSIPRLRQAVKIIRREIKGMSPKPLVETSGGIQLRNVRRIAEAGVDRISVGALTHSAPVLDFSLEMQKHFS